MESVGDNPADPSRRDLLDRQYLAGFDQDVHDMETARQRSGLTIGDPGWNLLYDVCFWALDRTPPGILPVRQSGKRPPSPRIGKT